MLANANLLSGTHMKAALRYNGVVYQGFGYATLDRQQRLIADRSVVVVSGLLGLCRLGDPIPDYRAPLDASIHHLGKLTQFWRPHLEPILARLSSRHLIIDLLPQLHRSAVTPTPKNWVRVNIVNEEGAGGHAAKYAKGELARWLLAHNVSELKRWRSGSWTATAD